MQNKIIIEGNDNIANYSIMCNGEFLVQVIINLYKSIIKVDSDGHIATRILDKIAAIAEEKYLKK